MGFTKVTKTMALEAKKKDKLIFHEYGKIRYARFREDFRGIERGTVIVGNRVIYAYPQIKRVFTLEKGLNKNINSDYFYVEEKIDGYNVRIAFINNEIFAFSRGGFIDAFATEKAKEHIPKKFFVKFPDYVICCEIIGNTPYTKPTKEYDVKLYVFDIDKGNNQYLTCDDRYKLLKKFGIGSIPVFGKFSKQDIEKIKQIALLSSKSRKEGIVIKSHDSNERIKYVTPFADIEDINNNMHLLFDMPIGFYNQRILRSAIFIKDFALGHKEYEMQIGKAVYEKFIETLKKVENGENVSEEFEITIKDLGIWYRIVKQMSREIKIEKIFERKEDNGNIRIRFRKIYKKTTKRLRELLNGKGITD